MSLIAALERIASAVDEQGGVSTKCQEFAEVATAPVETLSDCIKVLTLALRTIDTQPAPAQMPIDGVPATASMECNFCKNPIKVLALAVVAYGFDRRHGRTYSPVLVHKGQCHNSVTGYLALTAGEALFCEARSLAEDKADRLSSSMLHDIDRVRIKAIADAVRARIAEDAKQEEGS